MRRAFTLHSKTLKHFTSNLKPIPCSPISDNLKSNTCIIVSPKTLSSSPYTSNLRFFSSSSENDSSNQTTESKSEPTESKSEPTESKSESTESKSEPTESKSEPTESKSEPTESKSEPTESKSESTESKSAANQKDPFAGFEDVSTKDLKAQLDKYFKHGKQEVLSTVFESILKRKLAGKHEDSDNELIEHLEMKPLDEADDQEFEAGLEDVLESDDEIYHLCDARNRVARRMSEEPFYNMNQHKWDSMVQEAVEKGYMKNPKECEDIIEDMLKWDNLLPDHAKQKIEKKSNEIGDLVERGEFTPEEGYALLKEFEDKLLDQLMDEEKAVQQFGRPDKKKDQDNDLSGNGPILRWQSCIVFVPGGDARHPKNRKVKMSVTVKELGLSTYQFLRLRELVGKRYNSGKDELTLTSERFENREENRKDCLRTLYALVDEARKADKLIEDARASYVKERLKSNPEFMEKLRAKVLRTRESNTISA